MPLKQHLRAAVLSTACLGAFVPSAQSYSVDQAHFHIDPVVVVWAANESTGEIKEVIDFIVEENGTATDLIPSFDGRAIGNNLQPTEDATFSNPILHTWRLSDLNGEFEAINPNNPAAFDAFDVADVTVQAYRPAYDANFFVASNTPFTITAEAALIEGTPDLDLSDIAMSFQVLTSGTMSHPSTTETIEWGGHAQNPGGTPVNFDDLADITSETTIYTAAQPTAASSGTIAEQSVRFKGATKLLVPGDAYIDLSTGYGTLKAAITYTVYVL
ncbi:MAG: hypothetical protein AAGL90_16665 [Pseudomonadota bacterium]